MCTEFALLCDQLATEAHALYCRNLQKLYLTGEMIGDRWLNMRFSTDGTSNRCIIYEHVPRNNTVHQLYWWFAERLPREPCL